MVVPTDGQIDSTFIKQLVPAFVLGCFAVSCEEPLIVFHDYDELAGIGLYGFPDPGLCGGKSFFASHTFTVEHYKQGFAVFEVVTNAFLAFVAIVRVVVGVSEIVVGQSGRFAVHIVMVAVDTCPYVFEK